MARCLFLTCVGLVVSGGAGAGTTRVTVQAAPSGAYGGYGYGGLVPLTGATISQELEVQVDPKSEIRVVGVASTIDPGSIQLRDRTEPALAIAEQRFVPGATTPTEIITRSIGEQVAVTTPKGEVTGTLRAVDNDSIVVETVAGLAVLRRANVLDLRIANASAGRPTLVWRVAAKQPGKHDVELTYRAEGLAWTADYLAVVDDAAQTVDFTALANIKNATGATFERAHLTLVSGAYGAPALYGLAPRPPAPPSRYVIPQPVTLATGQAVQVELMPRKTGTRFRPVVAFEAMPDPSPSYQGYPNTDCTQFSGAGMGPGRADLTAELDVANSVVLPDGRARLFRRTAGRTELVSEDPIASASGTVRIRLATDGDIVGQRRATACKLDESARTLAEKVEVKITNRGKATADVVVREFAWRWPVWRLEHESAKSRRGGAQTQEYRFRLAPKATQSITYSVVYAW